MLLQVHDELIFDMEPSEKAHLVELIRKAMIGTRATLPHRDRYRNW